MKDKRFFGDAGDGFQAVLDALGAAEDAVSRLDARVGESPLAQGWRSRVACHEVVAWRWNAGEAVPLEDVVLHAAHLGQQALDPAVSAALEALARRRKSEQSDAEALERWETVKGLLRRRPAAAQGRSPETAALLARVAPRRDERSTAPLPSYGLPILKLMDWDPCPLDQDDEVFGLWVTTAKAFTSYRALLQAAASLDHWMTIQPLVRESDVGALIVDARLRRSRRLRASPLLVELGRRALSKGGRYWNAAAPANERACYWLDAIAAGAEAGLAELDLLSIARQRLDRVVLGRRASSHLPALANLMLTSPVVSANMVAETLGVTPQAARLLLAKLDGVVSETTGRSSYRIWRL